MKNIIESTKIFLIAIVGLVVGLIWAYNTQWEYEPIILCAVSIIEIAAFFLSKVFNKNIDTEIQKKEINIQNKQIIKNKGSIKNQININKNNGDINL